MFRLACVLALIPLSGMAQAYPPTGLVNDEAGPAALFADGQKLYAQNTPESLRAALTDFQKALVGWQSSGDESKQIDALLAIGTTQFVLHDPASCQKDLEQAQQLAAGAHDQLGEAKVAAGTAVFMDAEKDENGAIGQAKRSADLFHSLNRPGEESQVLFFLSILLEKINDQANLIATYERALPVAEAANNTQFEALINLRLGQYSLLKPGDGAHQQALAYFEKALSMFRNSTDQFDLAMTWWGMGTAEDYLHDQQKSQDAYRHAADLSSVIKIPAARGRLFDELGHEELQLKMWAEAEQHLRQAIALLGPEPSNSFLMAELDLGTAQTALNDQSGALKTWEQAADDSHRAGAADMETVSWERVAAIHDQSYDWKESIEANTKAVAAARSPGGSVMLPAALASLSSAYLNTGQHQKSLEIDQEVLPLLEGKIRTNLLVEMGINYSWLGQYASALHYLNQGMAESAPNSAERGGLLVVLAEVHTELNDLDAALDESKESRDIYHNLQIANGEAKALNQLGLVYQAMGDRANSKRVLNEALANERANSNVFAECSTLNNLGELQRYFGDFRKAQPLYEQALALARQIGDRYREADILVNLSAIEHSLGQETGAIASLHQALDIRRELQDPNGEAKVLSDIGLTLLDNGEPQQGLNALMQSLSLFRNSEDMISKATALDNLGTAYYRLGVYQDAETYFQQAQDLDTKLSLDSSLLVVLNNLATLELAQGLEPGASSDNKSMRLERAAQLYGQALPLAKKIGDKLGQMRILTSEALIESEQGHQEQALQTLQQCRVLNSNIGDLDSEALIEHTTGTVYARLNENSTALQHFRVALPLWQKIGSMDGEEQTHYVMAKAERKAGRPDLALTAIQTAIRLSAELTGRVATDENRSSLFATTSNYYELEIDLLMQMSREHPGRGYEAQALEVSEGSRARSLLDLLAEAHANIRQGVAPKLLADERSTARALAAKESLRMKLARSADSGSGEQTLKNEIAALNSQYDLIEARIRANSPAYAALTQSRPLTAKEIQTSVLDPNTVLLEYSLGEERSYLWAVTTTSLRAYELPARQKIEERAENLFRDLRTREPADDDAAYLSQILLTPAAKGFRKRIVIVADGELQQVPFAVLPEPGAGDPQLLLAHHEIVVEPSASAVAVLRGNRGVHAGRPKLLAMIADPVFNLSDDRLQQVARQPAANSAHVTDAPANPLLTRAVDRGEPDGGEFLARLAGSGAEAQSILQMRNPDEELALLGFDANKSAVQHTDFSNYRIVHFATHGLVNADRPALSGLVLSLYDQTGHPIDGFLTLNDIYNLQLPVKLVVLSACESGQGQMVRGEGIVGLTRGFLYAGAASLVVSLWNVNDQSTAELMRRFYESLLSEPDLHPAAALRIAQLSMMQEKKWEQPYYWAAFTVQGDWQ